MPSRDADTDTVNLLDVDPDLASRLREDDRLEAREHLDLPLTTVPVGRWALTAGTQRARTLGIVVVTGVLLREVQLAGRSAMQLVGPGDIVLPNPAPTEALDVRIRWSAATESRIAVLDDRLQAPFAMWPGLALGLLAYTGRQMARLSVQAAISQLPRVDQRLEATFWQLAERWGRMTPSGIHIPLALTHEVLARLVGGRRPTISLALTELTERGVLLRRPDRTWLIMAPSADLPPNPEDEPLPVLEAQVATPLLTLGTEDAGWSEEARRALLSNVRRLRAENQVRRRQIRLDLEHAAMLRRRTEDLRAQIAAGRPRDPD